MTKSERPSPLKVVVEDPFGNGAGLARALERAGHRLVTSGRADVLLIELDMPKFEFRETIDRHKAAGAKVLLYPHGAGLSLHYDNLFEPYDAVDGNLLFSIGHAEVLRRIGYPKPTHVMGWYYTELAPFRPAREVRHVVFAPTHPSGADNNTMADTHRAANAEAFARLVEGPWRLTVRHLGQIEQNGLWKVDGVNYVAGTRDKQPIEIEAADVVVAGDGSFPSMAVARGVPTVIYGQAHPPTYGLPGEELIPLRSADRYLDYIRYPFDVEDGPIDEVMHAAAQSEAPIAQWKRRFIGEPLEDQRFASLIERAASRKPEPPAVDETRGVTVVAFADELLERPELLAAYARRFGPEDDATLVVWAPGADPGLLLWMVQAAADAAGVEEDRLPDVLLLPLPGSPEADALLAERADAVLSEWPPVGRLGALPRHGAADLDGLRRRAAL